MDQIPPGAEPRTDKPTGTAAEGQPTGSKGRQSDLGGLLNALKSVSSRIPNALRVPVYLLASLIIVAAIGSLLLGITGVQLVIMLIMLLIVWWTAAILIIVVNDRRSGRKAIIASIAGLFALVCASAGFGVFSCVADTEKCVNVYLQFRDGVPGSVRNLLPMPTPRSLTQLEPFQHMDNNGNVRIGRASVFVQSDGRPILRANVQATDRHTLMGRDQAPWVQVELYSRGNLMMTLDQASLAEVRECGCPFGCPRGVGLELEDGSQGVDLSRARGFNQELMLYVDAFRVTLPGGTSVTPCPS